MYTLRIILIKHIYFLFYINKTRKILYIFHLDRIFIRIKCRPNILPIFLIKVKIDYAPHYRNQIFHIRLKIKFLHESKIVENIIYFFHFFFRYESCSGDSRCPSRPFISVFSFYPR